MLYIDYAVPEDKLLRNPGSWYDGYYDKSWFDKPELVRVACIVDRLTHIEGDIFEHAVTGRCTGLNLSGGVKTIIVAYLGITKQWVLPLSWLGENCFHVMGTLDWKEDAVFYGNSTPFLEKWGCDFISKRTGKIINNYDDYYAERIQYGD